MSNEPLVYALYTLYAINIALIIALIARLYNEVRVNKLPLSINRLIAFLRYEVNGVRRSMVDFMHFSILAGVSLSMLYTILYPWIYQYEIAHYVMFGVATPLIAGLVGAFVWRVQVLARSFRVHGELNVDREFRRKSTTLQGILMAIIVLTASTLALTIMPSLFYTDVKMVITVADYLLIVLFYAKPEVNLYMNFDRGLPNVRMPFNMRDIIDGKVDVSQVRMGVEKLSEFENYEIHSFSTCVEIGACEEACPATAAGRPLSPRVLVRKLALLRNSSGLDAEALKVVGEDELWSCTTCGACTWSCPVGVRHIDIIMDLRRKLVELGRLDQKKSNLLLNLSQYGNSMGMANYGRHEWLRELGVKTVQENQGFEYLLWVGCMGSFDNRAREIIRAFVEVLREAGMLDKIAVLGDEETCCGDPARRLGEEGRFQEMALNNIELFRKYNVKGIITICPHGYNTFKNDYPKVDPWMSNVKVYHHVEFINELIRQGRIRINKANSTVFTIHDPCYLARYNEVVEPQRIIIRGLGELREAKRHGRQTFCCGAGGANYWYDVPEKKRISHIRLEQLMETNANTIVTLCPFCNAMLTDAARVKGVEDKVKVMDIVEVIRDSMVRAEARKAEA
ncbi:(Fe-S)-binding protein [Vulcanisaeta thermophila]|uniref:(Fe-S)-binding protein n=1 Tax=Vulcanisaeta thermophila TaxID=867917 RepID=UPI0008536781|nr:(Fe-S)-binding protein [Vulcanisaeta thermophila]